MISISIQPVQNNGHSWLINTSLNLKHKIKFYIFNEKPSLIVQINCLKIVFLLYWKSWRIGNVKLLLDWLGCFKRIIGYAGWFDFGVSFYIGSTFKFITEFVNWCCYLSIFLLYFDFFDIIGFILIAKPIIFIWPRRCNLYGRINLYQWLIFCLLLWGFFSINNMMIRNNSPKLISILIVFFNSNFSVNHITPSTSSWK